MPFASFSAAPGAAFHFEGLLQGAYARQDDVLAGTGVAAANDALDRYDVVDNAVNFPAGYASRPSGSAAPFPSNAQLDTAHDAFEGAGHDTPEPRSTFPSSLLNAHEVVLEPEMHGASEAPSTLEGAPTGPAPRGPSSAPAKGAASSARKLYRKNKEQARKTAKKTLLRGSSSQGALLCNPTAVARNLKDIITHQTEFKAASMPHTRPGYQGRVMKGAVKKVYTLEELVGEGSHFGFELRQWDGM